MSASTLPFELLLHVFRCLDARSFFAARRACRWWHLASLESVTLHRLLDTLPISPPFKGIRLRPQEAQCLAAKACRILMLDFHASDEESTFINIPAVQPALVPPQASLTALASGAKRMAAFSGASTSIFDTSASESVLLAQRPLEQKIGRGLWLQTWPLRNCSIALSSHGNILALSYNGSIQLYDISPGSDRCILNDDIVPTRDQRIIGLEFEQRDHLLRVRLSRRGGVVYLGSPPSHNNDESATFDHWTSKRGLQNTFLDSSQLNTPPHPNGVSPVRFSSLQLLRASPNNGPLIAAAQRHGGGQSSRYTLLHAACKTDTTTLAPRADPGSATELARLESFLSSLDYSVNRLLSHRDIGLWENMPSAQESNPRFCLSPDAEMLLLAEKERKRVGPNLSTQMFVYRLPSEGEVVRMLDAGGGKASSASERREAEVMGERDAAALDMFTVPVVPLCLGTVGGDVVDVQAEMLDGGARGYRFGVMTGEAVRSWKLERV